MMWHPAASAVVSTGGRDVELVHRAVGHAEEDEDDGLLYFIFLLETVRVLVTG
jgi:hypothetical protein